MRHSTQDHAEPNLEGGVIKDAWSCSTLSIISCLHEPHLNLLICPAWHNTHILMYCNSHDTQYRKYQLTSCDQPNAALSPDETERMKKTNRKLLMFPKPFLCVSHQTDVLFPFFNICPLPLNTMHTGRVDAYIQAGCDNEAYFTFFSAWHTEMHRTGGFVGFLKLKIYSLRHTWPSCSCLGNTSRACNPTNIHYEPHEPQTQPDLTHMKVSIHRDDKLWLQMISTCSVFFII